MSPCQSLDDPDYVAYIAWVDAGNQPTEQYETAAKTVKSVSPRQIRLAMNQLGMRAAVEAAVAASEQDIKDSWEFSTEFERDNPLIMQMAGALGIPETSVDHLFSLAATL